MLLNIGETGKTTVANTIDGGSTAAITFNNTYTNPVVIVQAVGGPAFAVARAKDITADSVTLFIQDDLGGTVVGGTYDISYLVVEAGTYILDSGHIFEAGIINTAASHDGSLNDGWTTKAIAGSFADPLLLHSPNSYNSGRFFATSAKDITRAGFSVTREISTYPEDHAISENVGYLVLDRSLGKTGSFVRYETGSLESSDTPSVASVGFDGVVFVSGQELNGVDGYYTQVDTPAKSDRWRFVTEGNGSTYVELPGVYDATDTKITAPSRSYNVSILDVKTNTFDEHVTFDVQGNKANTLSTEQANSTSLTNAYSLDGAVVSNDMTFSRGGTSSFRVDTAPEIISGIVLTPQFISDTDTIARAESWVLMPRGTIFEFGIRYQGISTFHSASTGEFIGTGEWQLVQHEDFDVPSSISKAGIQCTVIGDASVRFWMDDSLLVTHTDVTRIRNAQSMANLLYSLPRNGEKKVFVLTHGDPSINRFSGQLATAMYDIGASEEVYGGTFESGSAYLLVGEPGISKGNALVELYAGDIASDPNAYIDHEFFLTNQFSIWTEEPSSLDGGHVVEKIAYAIFDPGNLTVNDNDYTPVYDVDTLYTYEASNDLTYNEYTMVGVTSINNSEAFGSPTTVLFVKPADFADASGIGEPTALVQPASIGAIGDDFSITPGNESVVLPQSATVTAIGWENSDTFGNFTLSPQPVVMDITMIDGEEVVAAPTIFPQPVITSASSIASMPMTGSLSTEPQPVYLQPIGIESGANVGDLTRVSLNPDAVGILSGERVPDTLEVLPQPILLTVVAGIPSESSMSQVVEVLPQQVSLYATAFSEEQFGIAQLHFRIKDAGNIGRERGIDQYYDESLREYGDYDLFYTDELGGHAVKTVVRTIAVGIPAEDDYGVHAVAYGVTPPSITGATIFGDVVALQSVLLGTSVNPQAAVGTPTKVSNTFVKSRIRDFDEALWYSLFDKEQYAYDQTVEKVDPASYSSPTPTYITVEGREVYEPKFQALQEAIYVWLDINRKAPFKDFINGLYSCIIFNRMYGTDGSLLPSSFAAEIFNMDGYVERIKNDPIEYYHDYVESCVYDEVEMTTTCTEETPNLDADILLIQGSYEGQELPVMESLTSQYQDIVSTKTHDLMFSDYPIIEVVNKDQMTNQIFVDMEYRRIYESMNVGLASPPDIPRTLAVAA